MNEDILFGQLSFIVFYMTFDMNMTKDSIDAIFDMTNDNGAIQERVDLHRWLQYKRTKSGGDLDLYRWLQYKVTKSQKGT